MMDTKRLVGRAAMAVAIAGASYVFGARKAQAPGADGSDGEPMGSAFHRASDETSTTSSGSDTGNPQNASGQHRGSILDELLAELGDQAVAELKTGLKRGLRRLERAIDEL